MKLNTINYETDVYYSYCNNTCLDRFPLGIEFKTADQDELFIGLIS